MTLERLNGWDCLRASMPVSFCAPPFKCIHPFVSFSWNNILSSKYPPQSREKIATKDHSLVMYPGVYGGFWRILEHFGGLEGSLTIFQVVLSASRATPTRLHKYPCKPPFFLCARGWGLTNQIPILGLFFYVLDARGLPFWVILGLFSWFFLL